MKNSKNISYQNRNNLYYRISKFIHYLLCSILLTLISKYVLLPILNTPNQLAFLYDSKGPLIPDFSWLFNFVKTFWFEQLPPGISIYSVENHLYGTRLWLGTEQITSLAFGYSPTMLLILAPLVLFSHAVAFCIFGAFSLLALWWQTHPIRCRFGVGILAVISPPALLCFLNSQTSLLTGAGLLYLAERSQRGFKKVISMPTILCALVIWGLTAKPPLALIAVVVLLALRQWQPVLVASILVLISTLLISPYLGSGWIMDYTSLISNYNRVEADPVFTSSFAQTHMANLRGVLNVDFNLSDNIASRVSSLVWIAIMLVLIVQGRYLRLTVGGLWSISLLSYLLFCSHVSSTEVLQILLLIPLCISAETTIKLSWKEWILMFIIPALPFLSPLAFDNRLIMFCGLLCILVLVVFVTKKSELKLNSV